MVYYVALHNKNRVFGTDEVSIVPLRSTPSFSYASLAKTSKNST